jgi:cellulose synthase/poly-beta-1,6-N-acetylglucosamine synthase-like glycosyltransferase
MMPPISAMSVSSPAIRVTFEITGWVVISYYLALNGYFLFLLISAWLDYRRYHRRLYSLNLDLIYRSPRTPPISILVPAFNEQKTIIESVRSLLALHYPRLEVVVVNDGSSDGTLAVLTRTFSLRRADVVYREHIPTRKVRDIYLSTTVPQLVVVDKENGGKADSLNVGVNLARSPWVCSVDADAVLEEEGLLRVIRPALEDPQVVASAGIIRIVNGCEVSAGRILTVRLPRQPILVFQVLEYLRGFFLGRLGWNATNCLMIISGAFGVFRRDVLLRVGGYKTATVGEDMEIVVRLHRMLRNAKFPYRIVFVPDPVCWTEAPARLDALGRQRTRWQRGLCEALAANRNMLFKPSYGYVGLLAFPYHAILELFGPILEVVGWVAIPSAWVLGFLSTTFLLWYLLLSLALGTLQTVLALFLQEVTYRRYPSAGDLLRLFIYSLFEHLGYHQLTVVWRLRGTFQYLWGSSGWGQQNRVGFGTRRKAAG